MMSAPSLDEPQAQQDSRRDVRSRLAKAIGIDTRDSRGGTTGDNLAAVLEDLEALVYVASTSSMRERGNIMQMPVRPALDPLFPYGVRYIIPEAEITNWGDNI